MHWDPERALAAVAAASETRLNYARIAQMYGQGATESAIEHRFRPIRRQAEEMRSAAVDGNSSTGDIPQPRTRTRRPTVPKDDSTPRATRTSEKRSTKTGTATKKSSKAKGDRDNAIAVYDSGEGGDESNVFIKRAKRETTSLAPRNQLPDLKRTPFVDSSSNGYELPPPETSTNAPEQDDFQGFSNMMGSNYGYPYFDEA